MNNKHLPPFHIFCAGTQMTGYAWLAAKCLIESCPKEKKESLKILIHLVGLSRREKSVVREVLAALPNVEIVEDIILPDERKIKFDRLRADLFGGYSRNLAKKIGYKFSFLQPLTRIIAGPENKKALVFYHHE